ncbi:MAG: hypothetical protein ACP6IU_14545 [Candidatus Asgardarchaeia archaeon]
MSTVLENINKLIENAKSDEASRFYLNVIRVLSSYYGVLWISELYGDLIKFYSVFEWEPDFDLAKVEKAVTELERMGLVDVEERFKATFSKEPRKEKFVRLSNMEETLNALKGDEILNKFLNRF